MSVTQLNFKLSAVYPVQLSKLVADLCDASVPGEMAEELEEIFFTALSSPDYTEFSTSTRGELVFTHRKLLEFLRGLHAAGCVVSTSPTV